MRTATAFFALSLSIMAMALPVAADCPTTSICPEDGGTGNPTGQYKWQGATEFAQYSHISPSGKRHVWWDRCN